MKTNFELYAGPALNPNIRCAEFGVKDENGDSSAYRSGEILRITSFEGAKPVWPIFLYCRGSR